jgi:hypothetical protein
MDNRHRLLHPNLFLSSGEDMGSLHWIVTLLLFNYLQKSVNMSQKHVKVYRHRLAEGITSLFDHFELCGSGSWRKGYLSA